MDWQCANMTGAWSCHRGPRHHSTTDKQRIALGGNRVTSESFHPRSPMQIRLPRQPDLHLLPAAGDRFPPVVAPLLAHDASPGFGSPPARVYNPISDQDCMEVPSQDYWQSPPLTGAMWPANRDAHAGPEAGEQKLAHRKRLCCRALTVQRDAAGSEHGAARYHDGSAELEKLQKSKRKSVLSYALFRC